MKETKFVQVLMSFDKAELKEFERFINSSYFVNRKFHIPFFNLIKKHFPDFESPSFTKEKLFAKLYPGKEFDNSLYLNLTSNLMKLAEEFMILKQLETRPFMKKRLLLESLYNRNLDSLFEQHSKSTEREINSNREIDGEYFYDQFTLNTLIHNYYSEKQETETDMPYLYKSIEYFILEFSINYTQALYMLLGEEMDSNENTKESMIYEIKKDLKIENFIEYLKASKSKYYPLIAMYYYLYKAYEDLSDESYFIKFKELVRANGSLFGHYEEQRLYVQIEGYCTQQINSGNDKYRREMFEIHNEMLAENLHLEPDRFMHIVLFRNFILTALQLEEFEWAESFIRNYISDITEMQRENIQNYSMAMLHYSKKNYGDSLAFLNRVKYEVFLFRLDVKVMTLKNYYELNHYEEAFSLIDTYRKFLMNNEKLADAVRRRHVDFINIVNDMLRYKTGTDGIEPGLIEKSIQGNPSINSREWLIEKVRELK